MHTHIGKAIRQRFDSALKGGAKVIQFQYQGVIIRVLDDTRLKFNGDQLKVT